VVSGIEPFNEANKEVRVKLHVKSVCSWLVFFGLLGLFLAGCSISNSVSSSSDSSRSISRSSTSGSGSQVPEETKEAYVKDVITYVSALGRSDIGADDFMRGMSSIAQRHSISDWEGYRFTYVAIGRGLRQAGLAWDEVATLPYLKPLIQADSSRLKYIKEGFDK